MLQIYAKHIETGEIKRYTSDTQWIYLGHNWVIVTEAEWINYEIQRGEVPRGYVHCLCCSGNGETFHHGQRFECKCCNGNGVVPESYSYNMD